MKKTFTVSGPFTLASSPMPGTAIDIASIDYGRLMNDGRVIFLRAGDAQIAIGFEVRSWAWRAVDAGIDIKGPGSYRFTDEDDIADTVTAWIAAHGGVVKASIV